jgi:tRNA(Leu) C34 or U34 (ribose-2'-O)-methylase TrmL
MAKKINRKIVKLPKHIEAASREIKNAYYEWADLKEKLQTHPSRYYTIPHPENPEENIQIDLIQAPGNVKKKLRHLPEEEIERILLIHKRLQGIKGAIGGLKRKWDPPTYTKTGGINALEPYATEVIEMLGQWKTVDEVRKEIFDRWGYEVTANKITRFKRANQDKIDALRTEWERSYDDFDVARKRGRIERLAYLAKTQMDRYQKNNDHSVVFSREIRAILEQIRKEVEGERIAIDVNGNIDVNSTINMNLSIQKLSQKISINSVVVALVAAKRGISGVGLMERLTKSYYRQYNGFMRVSSNMEDLEYPSNLIQTYDWNEIERLHRTESVHNYEAQDAEIVEEPVKPGSIKNEMLEMLNSRQDELQRITKK